MVALQTQLRELEGRKDILKGTLGLLKKLGCELKQLSSKDKTLLTKLSGIRSCFLRCSSRSSYPYQISSIKRKKQAF